MRRSQTWRSAAGGAAGVACRMYRGVLLVEKKDESFQCQTPYIIVFNTTTEFFFMVLKWLVVLYVLFDIRPVTYIGLLVRDMRSNNPWSKDSSAAHCGVVYTTVTNCPSDCTLIGREVDQLSYNIIEWQRVDRKSVCGYCSRYLCNVVSQNLSVSIT